MQETMAENGAVAVPRRTPKRRRMWDPPSQYAPLPYSKHTMFQVQASSFAGPIDLLLALIRQHSIDVCEVSLAWLCSEYVACLAMLQEVEIDVAGEFLDIASQLLYLKARQLLPDTAGDADEEGSAGPVPELAERLMELECYRQAARQLEACDRLGRDTFARPPELPAPGQQLLTDEAQLQEVSVFALVKSFDAVLTRTRRQGGEHQVALATVTIRERLEELCSALQPQELVAFEDVLGTVPVWDRVELVVTFMALLELTRLQLLKLYQSERGVLYVKALFGSRDEVWQRLKVSQEENHAAV